MESEPCRAARLADLAMVLALEATAADGADTLWCASPHEALLALAGESCGSPALVRAAKELVDPKSWEAAHALLTRAEIYAAFWGD